MLVALVRLLPYLKPDTWPNVRPLDVLPRWGLGRGVRRQCVCGDAGSGGEWLQGSCAAPHASRE